LSGWRDSRDGAYAGAKGKVLLHQINNRRERDSFRFS